jgi:surfactin synthase thioesterase subunit/non-ribosomal peptide synthetase component F
LQFSTGLPAGEVGVGSVVLARRENVALRLFAFPHAGGSHNSYRDWSSGLPDDVEIVSYSLPGRGRLQDEPPYADWQALVDDLADLVARHDDGTPFAFFGHSFGALAAFDVGRRLAAQNRRGPELLFVSGHRAPHLPPGREKHSLPADQLLDLVRDSSLVPEELLADEDLLQLVIPPLRADLKLDEEYPCQTGGGIGRGAGGRVGSGTGSQTSGRLSVPCVVYGGADDRTVRLEDLRAWGEHFDDDVEFHLETFPGGHFYTVTSEAALLDSMSRHLDQARSDVGGSVVIAGGGYPAPDRSVWARFREHVTSTPDALALVDHPRQWSYLELCDSATALASDLAARGIAKGDVVGLLLPHSAEYCISLLTCFGIGAPACLLEKNWPASLLGRFLESAGVEIVVTTSELVGLLPAAFQVPGKFLVLGQESSADIEDEDHVVFPDVEASDIALISMTSGTSGTPKAVLNTHLSCLYCFDARYQLYPYQESSRDGLNVFFGWECLRPLLQGKPAVVIPDDHIFDPVRLVAALEEFQITRVVVPPSLFESVLDHPAVGPVLADRLRHMEAVFLMGEVVPTRVVEKAAALLPAHVRLVNSYSTRESLDVSFADLLPRPACRPIGLSPFAPAGRILDGSAAVLLNDRGELVPYGGVGELYFSGPGVAVGYLDDPLKTAERFVRCPTAFADPLVAGSHFADELFYRTGDRARFRPGGELEILGRTGDVVKVRGFKVSLRAVETVLEEQSRVSRVIGRPVLDRRTDRQAHPGAHPAGAQDPGHPVPPELFAVAVRGRDGMGRDVRHR